MLHLHLLRCWRRSVVLHQCSCHTSVIGMLHTINLLHLRCYCHCHFNRNPTRCRPLQQHWILLVLWLQTPNWQRSHHTITLWSYVSSGIPSEAKTITAHWRSFMCKTLWDSFYMSDTPVDTPVDLWPLEQLFLVMSKNLVSCIPTSRIVCLAGSIQDFIVHILSYFGSSSSFINEALVTQLQHVAIVLLSSSVQVARGS